MSGKTKHFNILMVSLWTTIGTVMMLLAACGFDNGAQSKWIYVPEYISFDNRDFSFQDVQVSGNSIYFLSQDICRYSVEEGLFSSVMLNWQSGETDRIIEEFFAADDGSIYLIAAEDTGRHVLVKFDALGNQIYLRDVTEQAGNSMNRIAADSMGRLYFGSGAVVWLYDEAGNEQGSISLEDSDTEIIGLGCDRKGNMYAVCYGKRNDQGAFDLGNSRLAELDFNNKKSIAAYSDVSLGNNNDLISGMEEDFLILDNIGVYEYDLAAKEKEMVFGWLECNIEGSFVNSAGILADGRIAVIYENWLNDDRGIVLLTKTPEDQVAQKETIVVAVMYYNSWLQTAAINFNRSSDRYEVVIRQYAEEGNNGADALSDAVVNLKNALASADCPDIIDLAELDIEQLAAAGVLEDLSPYLDNSRFLSRTDFLENILEEYTIEGSLVTIPYKVNVRTVVGSSAKTGERSGWTLDEIVDFSDAYPESELFGSIEKREILQYLMMFSKDTFINWRTGECRFDSGQFENLLRFVGELPAVPEQNSAAVPGPAIDVDRQTAGTLPNPVRIQNGEVLLDIEYIFDFDTVQMCEEMFQGDVACIGFPTLDGTGGHAIDPWQVYGITARSDRKEGAWEFIESFLLQEENGFGADFGFPTRKAQLEKMIERTLNSGCLLDENGNLLLNEEGNFVEDPNQAFASVSKDGWRYTYRRTTQEEIDIMLAVLEDAKRVSGSNNAIINIIMEEADGFFAGQKTLGDVVDVIQSRVSLYVEENR